MADQFQNFFATRLYTAIGAGDTTITLETPPTVTAGRLVLEGRNATQREIIKYTGVSGNQITGVSRGQNGTTANSHVKNSLVEMNVTAKDLQDLYDAFSTFAAAATDWRSLVNTVTTVTYNGNHSYDMTFLSSVASLLSPGMRLRVNRTVAAPTQSTSLNGTTQYFSKASPAGMTFTDDFVCSAWVKLTSYAACGIITRTNGTSGFGLYLLSTGQVQFGGNNAGGANFSEVRTYQSLPLNKWVHITAQLDMSTFTASTTTSYIMIDGVDVLSFVSRTGTSPTALVQAGDLNIGATNGSSPFPGKIAQAAIFSAKVTQATMRTYISQGLLGTEPNLISAYSFNNSITDLNTVTANNLTANGSAVATNADSPFGGQAGGTIDANKEYVIVEKVNGTVATLQSPEGGAVPTIGGVSSVDYTGVKNPYGFPAQSVKWVVESIYRNRFSGAAGALGTWSNFGHAITAPTGEWKRSWSIKVAYTHAGVAYLGGNLGLSTTTTTQNELTSASMTPLLSVSSVENLADVSKSDYTSIPAATVYYLNQSPVQNSQTANLGDQTALIHSYIRLENALL